MYIGVHKFIKNGCFWCKKRYILLVVFIVMFVVALVFVFVLVLSQHRKYNKPIFVLIVFNIRVYINQYLL